jgi:hypothetical protein
MNMPILSNEQQRLKYFSYVKHISLILTFHNAKGRNAMKMKIFLSVITLSLTGAGFSSGLITKDHGHENYNSNKELKDGIILEHGGGLDKCGGHNDRKNGSYHYHQGPFC